MAAPKRIYSVIRLHRAPSGSSPGRWLEYCFEGDCLTRLEAGFVTLDEELTGVLRVTARGCGIIAHLYLQRDLRARHERSIDDGMGPGQGCGGQVTAQGDWRVQLPVDDLMGAVTKAGHVVLVEVHAQIDAHDVALGEGAEGGRSDGSGAEGEKAHGLGVKNEGSHERIFVGGLYRQSINKQIDHGILGG